VDKKNLNVFYTACDVLIFNVITIIKELNFFSCTPADKRTKLKNKIDYEDEASSALPFNFLGCITRVSNRYIALSAMLIFM